MQPIDWHAADFIVKNTIGRSELFRAWEIFF
jgi:hypothetical protein